MPLGSCLKLDALRAPILAVRNLRRMGGPLKLPVPPISPSRSCAQARYEQLLSALHSTAPAAPEMPLHSIGPDGQPVAAPLPAQALLAAGVGADMLVAEVEEAMRGLLGSMQPMQLMMAAVALGLPVSFPGLPPPPPTPVTPARSALKSLAQELLPPGAPGKDGSVAPPAPRPRRASTAQLQAARQQLEGAALSQADVHGLLQVVEYAAGGGPPAPSPYGLPQGGLQGPGMVAGPGPGMMQGGPQHPQGGYGLGPGPGGGPMMMTPPGPGQGGPVGPGGPGMTPMPMANGVGGFQTGPGFGPGPGPGQGATPMQPGGFMGGGHLMPPASAPGALGGMGQGVQSPLPLGSPAVFHMQHQM